MFKKNKFNEDKLLWEKVLNKPVVSYVIGSVVIISMMVIGLSIKNTIITPEVKPVLVEVPDTMYVDTTFSKEKLVKAIDDMGLEFPHIVYAQAVLETGNFTSDIFRYNHNMFGMKRAYKRPSTCIATARGHGAYTDWENSLVDYALRQSYYRASKMRTDRDYYNHLESSGYAESPTYIQKLKSLAGEYQKVKSYEKL